MTRSTHSFQTWKQSIIVKFAFDLSSFVSSTLVVSGVAAIGAVGLHRSRDQLVAPKDSLRCSEDRGALEEEHELPSFDDYRLEDLGSVGNVGNKSRRR